MIKNTRRQSNFTIMLSSATRIWQQFMLILEFVLLKLDTSEELSVLYKTPRYIYKTMTTTLIQNIKSILIRFLTLLKKKDNFGGKIVQLENNKRKFFWEKGNNFDPLFNRCMKILKNRQCVGKKFWKKKFWILYYCFNKISLKCTE